VAKHKVAFGTPCHIRNIEARVAWTMSKRKL